MGTNKFRVTAHDPVGTPKAEAFAAFLNSLDLKVIELADGTVIDLDELFTRPPDPEQAVIMDGTLADPFPADTVLIVGALPEPEPDITINGAQQ